MKNKFHYNMLKKILIYSFLYIIAIMIAQAILSYTFQNLCSSDFKGGYFDLSHLLGRSKGFLMIAYCDSIRIGSVFILLIPYIFSLEHMIKRMVSIPMMNMTKELSRINYDDLSVRVKTPVEYELKEMENAFNNMLSRLDSANKENHIWEEKNSLLITGMAHDLKTPITTIRGYSQALNDNVIEDDEKKSEYLSAINRKSIQLDELITLLFDYVRLGSSEYKLSTEKIDLVELIKESIALYYTEFEDKEINFSFSLPDEKIFIDGDKTQLSRVFSNIYSNALKHNVKGATVNTYLEYNDGFSIIIEDNGKPIPKEIENHIFDPFVMGDYSRKSGTGNGLGLCIASKIMQLHNGSLSLNSSLSNGYTKAFIVHF